MDIHAMKLDETKQRVILMLLMLNPEYLLVLQIYIRCVSVWHSVCDEIMISFVCWPHTEQKIYETYIPEAPHGKLLQWKASSITTTNNG